MQTTAAQFTHPVWSLFIAINAVPPCRHRHREAEWSARSSTTDGHQFHRWSLDKRLRGLGTAEQAVRHEGQTETEEQTLRVITTTTTTTTASNTNNNSAMNRSSCLVAIRLQVNLPAAQTIP